MSIVNRDKDQSEERSTFAFNTPFIIGPSSIMTVGVMSSAQQLLGIVSSAFAVSGVPVMAIQVQRYTPTGITTIPVNSLSLLSVQSFANVGIQKHAVPIGASVFNFVSGDHLQIVTSGNNAAGVYILNVVVKNLQDINSNFGF